MPVKWKCVDCGYETTTPIEGVNVVALGNHLYCAKCAPIIFRDGKPQVRDFPSRGRMIRNTLLLEQENQTVDNQDEV